ncbi:MAG: hypothetical protein ACFB4J_04390 [Elainellaceae cyanobacterium]
MLQSSAVVAQAKSVWEVWNGDRLMICGPWDRLVKIRERLTARLTHRLP